MVFADKLMSIFGVEMLKRTAISQAVSLALAGAAFHAVAFDEFQLHQGNPAEEAVEGAQGAEHPAEKPAD